MEEGKKYGYLATSRQHGNALLGVRYQEEEEEEVRITLTGWTSTWKTWKSPGI